MNFSYGTSSHVKNMKQNVRRPMSLLLRDFLFCVMALALGALAIPVLKVVEHFYPGMQAHEAFSGVIWIVLVVCVVLCIKRRDWPWNWLRD